MEEKMETKNCPYCGEAISAVAKKCKHCGEILDPAMREIENLKRAQANGPVIVNNNNNNNNNNNGSNGNGGYAAPLPFAQKSRLTYILLAIFLGWLGVHDFYAGRTGMGILCLLTLGGWYVIVLLEILFVKSDGRGILFK
ncbi:MAG: TM2 domain-containing protein [Victivallaceae bacterium]|nr:TM2 domain-containing protein [Victivallaceae bacterium]